MLASDPSNCPPMTDVLVSMSCQVLMFESALVTQRLVSLAMLPTHVNFRASKLADGENSGSVTMLRTNVAIAVPSFGAAEYTKLVARREPAPGMFCGTTRGWP